jgi:hypothetical protein
MFATAFDDDVMEITQYFKRFSLVEECKGSGRPSTGGTEENLDRVKSSAKANEYQ